MKVKELIEELQKYDPDVHVCLAVKGKFAFLGVVNGVFFDGTSGISGVMPSLSDGVVPELTKEQQANRETPWAAMERMEEDD